MTRWVAICSIRSPGCPSTTRQGPRRRSCATARPRSPRHRVRTRSSSSAAARRRRPGCCSAHCATAHRCAASSPSTSTRECCRPQALPSSTSTRASRSTPSAVISRSTSARSPRSAGGWSCSWVRPSAISRPSRGPPSSPRCPTPCSPVTPCCSAPIWSRTPARLVRAYDDAAGVTARFNKNVLAVVNRELSPNFDLDAFDHVARWNADEERIEMWLRASSPQHVRVAALDLTVDFAAGEEMLTEVSCKFRPDGVDGGTGRRGVAPHALVDRRGGRLRPVALGPVMPRRRRGARPGRTSRACMSTVPPAHDRALR